MSEISVVVVGSTSINSVIGNGDTVNVKVGDQTVGGGNGQAATIQAGTVTTIDATQTATVTNVGTAYAAKFNFSIPRGNTGSAGPAASLSVGSVSTGTTAAVTITGTAPSQSISFVLQPGPTGPATSLSIGSVSTGTTAAVSITGTAPSQSLSFVLPQGPAGPVNSLSIGSVSTGATAAVSISGSSPSQSLSFVLPVGPKGDTGPQGPAGPPINLSDETPQPLGAATAGTALAAARADHKHDTLTSFPYGSLTGVPSEFSPSAHAHAVSDVAGLQAALDGKQAAGTYATLVGGTVPSSQLPSYVDDVIEYLNLAGFPVSGDVGKIFVARDTGKIYRWSGSAYIEISPSPGSTDSVTEGSTNLYFTNNRAAAAAPVASVSGRTGTITLTNSDVGLGNVTNVDATARSAHTGTQLSSTISDFTTESAKHGPVASVAGRTGTITISSSDVSGLASIATSGSASDLSAGTVPAERLPVATDATAGAIKVGTGLAIASGVLSATGGGSYSLPTATDTVLGGIKIGANLTITDGVLAATGGGGSYTLPTASSSVLGGVKVGANLTITDGVLAATGGGSIVEATSASGFPATGSVGTLYHATDVRRIYFWDATGGVYIEAGTSGGGGSGDGTDAALRALFVAPAPTSVTATISGSDASVSWTAPTVLSQTPITDYTVQSNSGSGWTTFTRAASTATSATVTGQGVGGYQFRVSATNGAGTGAYSSVATLASSKLTITRRNGSPSTFTGLGTAASPFTRAARVLNSNADGLLSEANGTAGANGGAYAFTATASGTAYVTVTFFDDANDGYTGSILKNGAGQGSSLSDGTTVTARSFAVAAGDVITFYSGNTNNSFSNVSVWVV